MLIASLHQGISDLIPTRLEFYENWLHATGMRDGRIGIAPLAAVLSFLRQEGEPYELVTGPSARKAFDLATEDPRLRDRYGRNNWGQSTLLYRRLVEAGATFVTAAVGTGGRLRWVRTETYV